MEADYMILVREWSITACEVGRCTHPPVSHFTIHGLWPENLDGTWPQYCSAKGFAPADVSDLLPRMRLEWPSVYATDARFWQHEWRRHGTCTGGVFADAHAFFDAVLQLNERYSLDVAIDELRYQLDTPYDYDKVQAQLAEHFGHRVMVHCEHGHVAEVWMCIDSELRPFDCPRNVEHRCPSVTLPSAPRNAVLQAREG